VFDRRLLNGIRAKSEHSLRAVIDKYTAYVCTTARNVLGHSVTHEDIEEIASDVFLALWENAEKIQNDSLKPYLGSVTRNKSLNRLRKMNETLPLEDDIATENDSLEDSVISNEERQAVAQAVSSMEMPDREIFRQFYYEAETAAEVAANMGLTEASVKHRLIRGREKLKQAIGGKILEQ
jgi:RNA polymerase sigma-70 factor (ECF subfamily)